MASKDFELFQKRLAARGATVVDRLERGKLDSFRYALVHSYNSEVITPHKGDLVTSKALINHEKLQMDYDQKTFSAETGSGHKIGDIFYWNRTDTHWLIIMQHITERAYFKASIKKALYKFKWRNDDGVVYEQWAALLGPVETKMNQQERKGIAFDVGNNTLTLWMGASEGTKTLDRYDKIMVAGKVWKINVVDDITTPSLVNLHLVEDLTDAGRDNTAEEIARDYEHMIEEVEVVSDYEITGLASTNAIKGLTQTYTISPIDPLGVWKLSSTLGTILTMNGTSVTILFSGALGSTELSYTIADVAVVTKSLKVTSMLVG